MEESEEEESEEEEESGDLLLFLPLAIPEYMQEGQALGKARHFNYNLPHGVKVLNYDLLHDVTYCYATSCTT